MFIFLCCLTCNVPAKAPGIFLYYWWAPQVHSLYCYGRDKWTLVTSPQASSDAWFLETMGLYPKNNGEDGFFHSRSSKVQNMLSVMWNATSFNFSLYRYVLRWGRKNRSDAYKLLFSFSSFKMHIVF